MAEETSGADKLAAVLDRADANQFAKNVSDETLVKASQAAAAIVQSQYNLSEIARVPKMREEWLKLYTRHTWTYAGIFAISSVIARLPRLLVKVNRKTGDRDTISDHAVTQLLEYPNPQMTGYDWLEMLVIHLESCGNAYSEISYETREVKQGDATVSSKRTPLELWTVRPDYLAPVPRKDGGGTDHWVFQVKKYRRKKIFQVDQILPFGYADPLDPLFGMGSLQPAVDDLRQDLAMTKWNLDFFEHGLTPQGIFRTEKSLQPYEAKEVAAQIREFLLGDQRRVLVLGKGMEWQTVSTDPKDVEFLAGRAENRQSVLAAMGVPPVKVGLLEHAKYDNYRLQAEAFHRDTILPKLRKIEGSLDMFLLPRYPDLQRTPETDWRLEFDVEELLAEDEDKLTDRVLKKMGMGLLTIDEALVELGHDPLEDEELGGTRIIDKRFLPLGAVVGEGGLPETGLEGAEDEVMDAMRQHEEGLEEKIKGIVAKAIEDRGV